MRFLHHLPNLALTSALVFLGWQLFSGRPVRLPFGPPSHAIVADPRVVTSLPLADGNAFVIQGSTRPTLLYVFHPDCQFCAQIRETVQHTLATWPGVRTVTLADAREERLIGYWEWPLHVLSIPKASEVLGVAGVPALMRVSRDGVVSDTWLGVDSVLAALGRAAVDSLRFSRKPLAELAVDMMLDQEQVFVVTGRYTNDFEYLPSLRAARERVTAEISLHSDGRSGYMATLRSLNDSMLCTVVVPVSEGTDKVSCKRQSESSP